MAQPEYLHNLFSLSGKTAVVIGGTGVLGGAIGVTLARAGAHCVLVGRGEAKGQENVEAVEAVDASAELFTADATRREDLQKIADHLVAEDRQCDVLVNAAGINSATPFLEISDDEWDRIFRVNLNSVRQACQVFGAQMLERKVAGSIINIASMSAITPLSRVFTYSASKAAVLNLTLNLAREWAPHGIRVNALSPGFFPAEQNRKILSPERVEKILGHTPMARFGEPEELAGAVLLLAAPGAGSFMTGHNLAVDGGFSAMTI
ncbi:SDR family oxidoreductase [Stratiformator vulcanicus]|uniref:Putative oxidoreductase UxuB n=1 Tax=Stratiformator vulcanicus TaxID=2527980 RepID=A0A517QYG8_9PLAN|nr:SDR family oxidoreductase [Stratiformator vulcanicus]QDT36685.1 putative oxidoreductase UxuB [Stratiformator vulcanicus]